MDSEDLSSFSPEPTFGLGGGHTCVPIFTPVLRSVLLSFVFLNKTITADMANQNLI